MKKGIWQALGAYGCWGLFPLYWKMLHRVPALQVVGHRIVWSFITLLIVLLFFRQWRDFRKNALDFRTIKIYTLAALLMGINWLVYVWSVNSGHVVEASLGYFINPLFSVLIGVVFFREKLRLWQWIPIGFAFLGVLYLTVVMGSLPWIALTLAISFALYGLVKKIAPLSSLHGLSLETLVLLVPAVFYLLFLEKNGNGALVHSGLRISLLLVGTGIVTTIPLLLFSSAAKRIPLSYIGILQYMSPSIQFAIGILVFHESFTVQQFIGFCFVWVALVIFGLDSFSAYRARSVEASEIE
jgi:chloramphenicol-sensitive protein RarD